MKELVGERISDLKGHFKSPKCKVLNQLDAKETLHKLHINYVLVSADKAAKIAIVLCKKYYIDTPVEELGINNLNNNNPTYVPIGESYERIIESQPIYNISGIGNVRRRSSFAVSVQDCQVNKSPYKHRFIAGSSKCTTKDQACLLTKLLSTIR